MIITDQKLEELFLKSKVIDQKTITELLAFSHNARTSLQEVAIEKGAISDQKLGELIASSLEIPFVEFSKVELEEEVFRVIPERMARKHKVIAFAKDKDSIKLGMADPTNQDVIDIISRKTSKKVDVHLATERDITNTLMQYRKDIKLSLEELLKIEVSNANNLTNEAPIAKIVDLLMTYAYRDKASDLHIEPEENNILIRFRIDSVLQDILYLDKDLLDRIVTRIKVLAKLRTDEHLSAQDGKMRIQIDDELVDVRVSIIPLTEGEKVVLRLLSSKFRQFSLVDLGMNKENLKKIDTALEKSYGMILSTGPTGSGKTTSIYALLKILNTREKNITTIEDPVEYKIKGLNQIQVNPKTNLNFANGLRSILRQDPNVIFVGEIRDSETASIAVNAALTGHLVLSTLHTNDAATALPRLIDMKVEPFLVSSTVNVIIAQRLVRKICPECKTSISIAKKELLKDVSKKNVTKYFNKKTITIFKGKGCKACHLTGYTGRMGIFEVLEVTEEIRRLIVEKRDSDVIRSKAIQEGMTTMLEDGLEKVIDGQTTLEEVLRVIKTESI